MNQLPLIEISEIVNSIVVSDNYQDIISISDIDAQVSNGALNEGFSAPLRLNAMLLVLVLEGDIQISIDYVSYKVTANYLVTIMPVHVIQVSKPSNDIKAKLLIIDKDFMLNLKPDKRKSALLNYMQIRKHPCFTLTPEEMKHLNSSLSMLSEKINLRTHAFLQEVIINSVEAFFLEMANIMIGKKDIHIDNHLSRKEEIMQQFMQLLLENVSRQHAVTFYSGKLCITTQYLSLILRELTGKSARQWIDDALLVEAKILLKTPRTTVQQVADNLNFADQSTFGKFFKKNSGISPVEYRKN